MALTRTLTRTKSGRPELEEVVACRPGSCRAVVPRRHSLINAIKPGVPITFTSAACVLAVVEMRVNLRQTNARTSRTSRTSNISKARGCIDLLDSDEDDNPEEPPELPQLLRSTTVEARSRRSCRSCRSRRPRRPRRPRRSRRPRRPRRSRRSRRSVAPAAPAAPAAPVAPAAPAAPPPPAPPLGGSLGGGGGGARRVVGRASARPRPCKYTLPRPLHGRYTDTFFGAEGRDRSYAACRRPTALIIHALHASFR